MKKYLFCLSQLIACIAYSEQRACEISYNDTLVSQRVHTEKSCGCIGQCCCDYAERPATRVPCYGAYSAPYRVGGCNGFFVDASLLYWEAIEENLSMGLADEGALELPQNGRLLQLDFNFKPGFQVGIGIDFDHDFWQARLAYTFFHPHTGGSSSSPPNGLIYPNWAPATLVAEAGQVSAEWDLGVDLIDLQLARHYYNGIFLTMKPFFGARAAFISQDYTVSYTPVEVLLRRKQSLASIQQTLNKENRTQLTGKEKKQKERLNAGLEELAISSQNSLSSWGVGPLAGCDLCWNFCGGFYLLGNSAFSLLYTDYSISTSWRSPGSSNNSDGSLKDGIAYLRPAAEVALGIGWEDYFMVDRWHFDISLVYDFNIFWSQNLFFNFDQNSSQVAYRLGDLYLHGLTLKLAVHF